MAEPIFKFDPVTRTPLQAHYQQCTFAGGMAHRLQRAGQAIKAFVSSHIVSVVFTGALLISVMLSLHVDPT